MQNVIKAESLYYFWFQKTIMYYAVSITTGYFLIYFFLTAPLFSTGAN